MGSHFSFLYLMPLIVMTSGNSTSPFRASTEVGGRYGWRVFMLWAMRARSAGLKSLALMRRRNFWYCQPIWAQRSLIFIFPMRSISERIFSLVVVIGFKFQGSKQCLLHLCNFNSFTSLIEISLINLESDKMPTRLHCCNGC